MLLPKTSTLLVIFLLLSAASLASYLFHQWSVARGGRTLGWAGMSLGATLLLAAVVVVVLSLSWVSARHSFLDDSQPSTPDPAALDDARGWEAVGYVGDSPLPDQRPAETPSGKSAPHAQPWVDPRYVDSIPPLEPPWAATQCVAAVNPDPADRTRWVFVNACQRPVAIVVASCSFPDFQCLAPGSTSWSYEHGEMILPSKLQRTITTMEETRHGRRLRYAACFVTSRDAIRLIGTDWEARTMLSWDHQFATARIEDECLFRIQGSVSSGRVSGLPIDAPPGRDAPETTP